MNFSFESFINSSFDYDAEKEIHTGLWLKEEQPDANGGRITIKDIDVLKDYPNTGVVTISGLHQDTFEYFIKTYGKQLRAIRFFKNKLVEDWSLLGTLPQLEYIYFFANNRITSLWDMTKNTSLIGLCIEDFSKLKSIKGIETARNLKDFRIGNAVWSTMVIDSLTPLANTNIESISFYSKAITDNNFSFLSSMSNLKKFDFPTNMLSTEQVAWITANYPNLEGLALCAKRDVEIYDSSMNEVPGAIIVGKRKPSLVIAGNEKRIQKYIDDFETLKKKYTGLSYNEAFCDKK